MPHPALPVKIPSQLISICRNTIKEQLEKIEHNSYVLKIPKVHDQVRMIRNTHFHLVPELFIQISGISEMSFPREKIVLYPGVICIIPRGITHQERVRAYHGPFMNMVTITGKGMLSCHLAKEEKTHRPQVNIFESFETPMAQQIKEYQENIIEIFHSPVRGQQTILKGLLLACLATILAVFEGKSMVWEQEHDKISRCKQLVMSNLFDHGLSTKQLAEWIKCSPDYLSYLFHKETTMRLNVYINHQRIEYAKYLLESTASTVSEVAWASGYYDPGYFIRIFKRATGETPKEYRKLR